MVNLPTLSGTEVLYVNPVTSAGNLSAFIEPTTTGAIAALASLDTSTGCIYGPYYCREWYDHGCGYCWKEYQSWRHSVERAFYGYYGYCG